MRALLYITLLSVLTTTDLLALGGEGYTIERVEVRGNVKTKPEVILGALTFEVGHRLDAKEVDASKAALYGTRLFKTVHLASKPGTRSGHAVVVVYIDEKRFGDLGLSLEYTELDGFGISADAFHVNLWGEGKIIGAEWGLGERFKKWGFNYTDPYLTDADLLLSVSVRGSSADRDLFRANLGGTRGRYDLERIGGTIGLGRQFVPGKRIVFRYSLDKVEVGAFQRPTITTNGGDFSDEVATAVGRETQAYIGVEFQYNPSPAPWGSAPGTDLKLTVEMSGKYIGSSDTFLRTHFEAARHFSTVGSHIFTLGGKGGVIAGTPPFYERFFLDGENQLRGFERREIAPEGGERFLSIEGVYSVPFRPFARFYAFGEWAWLERDLHLGQRSDRGSTFGIGAVLFKRVDISLGLRTGTLIVKSHRFGDINVRL